MIRQTLAATFLALTLITAASACSENRASVTSTTKVEASCSPNELIACAKASSIGKFVPDSPKKASGEPIKIGMINQENTPAGSFPELSRSAQGFVDWFNAELGGVHGRPLELDVCNTGFSAEGSTACGERFALAKVPVVLGGIDVFGNAIDTLRDAGIPYVGGIPVSEQSMKSTNSFQWSGGTWGASVAFAKYAATTLHAKNVAIVYGDFGSIAEGARAGEKTLHEAGVTNVKMVPFPILGTDLGSPLQAAWASRPDAIFVLAADSGCKAAFDAAHTMGITATMFFTGACAAPSITDALGNDVTEGAFFNVEGRVNAANPDADNQLYTSVMHAYVKDVNPVGVATVSARSIINLFAVLMMTQPDQLDAASVTELLRSQHNAPSFMGHDYTCDGKQFPDLPATCSPQQILLQMHDGKLEQVGDWIDVGTADG